MVLNAGDERVRQLLERLLQVSEEILAFTKLGAFSSTKERLEQELPSDLDRKVYQASVDGRSTREVAKMSGVSHTFAHQRWQRWDKKGLMRPYGTQEGRLERVFNLETFGLWSEQKGGTSEPESNG